MNALSAPEDQTARIPSGRRAENDVLYEQQQEIERLGSICDALVKRVKELSGFTLGIDAPANEKPPHY